MVILKNLCRSLLCVLILLGASQFATAQNGNNDPIILEISGAIENGETDVHKFSRADLEKLNMYDISTETPWAEGRTLFSGIRVRDLLQSVGATGTSVTAYALNDYSVDIPTFDFEVYNTILALKKNGEYLTIRDRGPLWIIYPWSDRPELQNELFYSRSIWQLKALVVK